MKIPASRVPASRGQQIVGALMIIAAIAYLVHFVPRGWVPHDEGMLGQSADRIVHGGIPHVDYEEPYTGGLSWLYAAVFKISGVDLVNVRWLLFIGAACAAWIVYDILRRDLPPIGAALGTWVAIGWSFPNYFAALPSWWLLICALACVWALVRHRETGQWRFLLLAGLLAGAAVTIKQTGVYLVVALTLSLLYGGGQTWASAASPASRWIVPAERLIRWGAAITGIALAAVILAPRILFAEGLFLFVPAAATAAVLFAPVKRKTGPFAQSLAEWPVTQAVVALSAAALPMLLLLVPYITRHRLTDFVYGSVFLPRRRLAFASASMPGAETILAAVPVLVLLAPARFGHGTRNMFSKYLTWAAAAAAILLPVLALWKVGSYQFIWQSSRAIAALLPLGAACLAASGRIADGDRRHHLFTATTILAWMSLNQFPFAAPIYFCYVAPLVVVSAVTAAGAVGLRQAAMVPWAIMLLLFAVLSSNRSYIQTLGVSHVPRRFDAPLNLPRAHLKVADDDRQLYRLLVFSIRQRFHGGQLVAGPDCPEVYFLSGLTNPSGALFEFFSNDTGSDDETRWTRADLIVINHGPHFSPKLSPELTLRLQRAFPYGEYVGRFEVRWR